jgi:hypothetical protein
LKRSRALELGLVCSSLLAGVMPARADAPMVVVIAGEGAGPLASRLSAELRSRGYLTRERSHELAGEISDDADAYARVDTGPPRVRVCLLRVERACEELAEADPSLLLIRAIETLRALLDDPSTTAPPRPIERVPVAPTAVPAARTYTAELAILATAMVPTSGVAFGAGAEVLFHLSWYRWLALELGGLLSALDPRVESTAGGASVATRLLWLAAYLRIPERVLGGHHLLIGGGAGIAGADVQADAEPPFEARSSSFVGLLVFGSAMFALHVHDRISLLAGGRLGAVLPQPVLFFAETEVARVAAPLVTLELGVAVDFGS